MNVTVEAKRSPLKTDVLSPRDALLAVCFPETKRFDPRLYVDKVPCDCTVVLLDSAGKKTMGMQTDERALFANKTWVLVAIDEKRDVRLTVDIPQDIRKSVAEKEGEPWVETRTNAGIDYVTSTTMQKSLKKKIERRQS